MQEAEIRALVSQQLAGFEDPRAIAAVEQWDLLVEPAPNGWLLYRPNADIGIAYSLSESWAETPWGVVDGFTDNDPSVRTYCPDLEDAVRDFVYNGKPPLREGEVDLEAVATQKAKQKGESAKQFAQRSASTLPSNSASMKDGDRYPGTCGACGEAREVRITKFEQLVFGICTKCYFSDVW